MKILLVDDSEFSRTMIKRFLNIEGVEVAEAANGIEALALHRSFSPEFVFLDITMPDLDGLATLRILKILDKSMRVIMVTAQGGLEKVQNECRKYGACSVIAKPVSEAALWQALNMSDVNRGRCSNA